MAKPDDKHVLVAVSGEKKRVDLKVDKKEARLYTYGDSVIQDAHWKKLTSVLKVLKL